MQARGGKVNYLDVLLGANSFADFIDRFCAVNSLMEADRKIWKSKRMMRRLEVKKHLSKRSLRSNKLVDKRVQLKAI